MRKLLKFRKISETDLKDCTKSIKQIDDRVKPQVTPAGATIEFGDRRRKPGETVDEYINALEELAKPCRYDVTTLETVTERMIRDRLL